jgi:hypothetical protein
MRSSRVRSWYGDSRQWIVTCLVSLCTTQIVYGAERDDRAILNGWQGSLESLQLLDLEGRDVTAIVRPRVDDGQITLGLTGSAQLVAKSREIATLTLANEEPIKLPGGIVVPTATPDGGPRKLAWLRLTLLASPMPAPWDHEAHEYATRLTFGLRPSDESLADVALDKPVTVKLGFEGLTGAEIPAFTIDAPGLDNEKTIDLRFVPVSDTPRILVRSTLSDTNLDIRATRRLDMRAAQRTILGLGLAETEITVQNLAPSGAPARLDAPAVLALEVDGRATPEPTVVHLAAGESSASFRLRSAGMGPVRVRVALGGLTDEVTIEQAWPWAPLAAALAGGALGGYTRRFVKGARRKEAGRRIAEGVVVALIAFVAGVLGTGLLGLPPILVATEAGAFLTGALAGFLGVTLLESMTRPARSARA